MSRRKPKTIVQAAQRYAEHVVKKWEGQPVLASECKLEIVMAYMAGALTATPGESGQLPIAPASGAAPR